MAFVNSSANRLSNRCRSLTAGLLHYCYLPVKSRSDLDAVLLSICETEYYKTYSRDEVVADLSAVVANGLSFQAGQELVAPVVLCRICRTHVSATFAYRTALIMGHDDWLS